MNTAQLEVWFTREQRQQLVDQLTKRVGLTRIRAECFVRLWIYLLVKQQQARSPQIKPPLTMLTLPKGATVCTLREAAQVFYSDQEQGSDRAAGMMLTKLANLGLIKKIFDGNTTSIEIQPIPEVLGDDIPEAYVELTLDNFDPRCDAIPVANLLTVNYNWMNRNIEAMPHRVVGILRQWASRYARGMRVLRRQDNLNPVGFYMLYPTAAESEARFFNAPSKGLHLSTMADVDPFVSAVPGDSTCTTVFIRSWMIDPAFLDRYRLLFLQDTQQTLHAMRHDFPNLCDLHTLIIHPSYEKLASALGFQKTNHDIQLSIYWMYLPIDRFLTLNLDQVVARAFG
jgi:hypothetical protein